MTMKTILFYGDSNTWGYTGFESRKRYPREKRFVGIIQAAFPDYEIISEGLPGRNLHFDHPIETDCNGIKTLPVILTSHDPIDLVAIMLGTNDAMMIHNNSIYNIRYAMEKTIQLIQATDRWAIDRKTPPKILLIAPPSMNHIENSPYYGQYNENSAQLVAGLPKIYADLATQYGCDFFDASFIHPQSYDGVHLTESEHGLLGKALIEKLGTMAF